MSIRFPRFSCESGYFIFFSILESAIMYPFMSIIEQKRMLCAKTDLAAGFRFLRAVRGPAEKLAEEWPERPRHRLFCIYGIGWRATRKRLRAFGMRRTRGERELWSSADLAAGNRNDESRSKVREPSVSAAPNASCFRAAPPSVRGLQKKREPPGGRGGSRV